MAKRYAIGIDIGATKILVGVVDESGSLIKKEQIPTNTEEGSTAIIGRICHVIQEMKHPQGGKFDGIGVGVAGQVEPSTGTVLLAGNLRWNDVPLKSLIHDKVGLETIVTNDVRASTWGEWLFGEGKGCQDLVCLFIGTGVGGGIVSGGRLLTGASNIAGELGHTVIDFNGPACTCGNWGCLEAYIGGWAIARKAQKWIVADPDAGQMIQSIADERVQEVSARIVFDAFRKGDQMATQIVVEILEAAAAGVVSIVNALNPQKLILGGGMMSGLPELVETVTQAVRQRALPAASESLHVAASKLGPNACVIGAASLILQNQKKQAFLKG